MLVPMSTGGTVTVVVSGNPITTPPGGGGGGANTLSEGGGGGGCQAVPGRLPGPFFPLAILGLLAWVRRRRVQFQAPLPDQA